MKNSTIRIITYILLMTLQLFAMPMVNEKACAECHKSEYNGWKGSHHDLAMQIANESTVLGDFENTVFISNTGIQTTFFKKDREFFVTTDSEEGHLKTYKVTYVFGVFPLQQYMIKFPDGKIQVLDIAWDNRSKIEGGQRWFHLHPKEYITHRSSLHWTGPYMNWNFMCADCHSTNLKKNYDPNTKSFNTSYDAINVSCEACHGSSTKHMQWVQKGQQGSNGFEFKLRPSSYSHKTRTGDKTHKEVEMCAKCHSRRSQLDDKYQPGDDFFQHYRNVTLDEALYFSDGKIKDEVYVFNSFKQSKMYEAGVTCSDCHDPHSLERKAIGEAVCYQCHNPDDYAKSSHTKHAEHLKDVTCISCHMPARTYMGVDVRNDHSFRIPRPDLSENTDIPNACNNCHIDKDASWATKRMRKWYGKIPIGKQNFAYALISIRTNRQDAQVYLYDVLMSDAPRIAKATVASYLGRYPSQKEYTTILNLLKSSDVELRLKALEALEAYPLEYRAIELYRALDDEYKIIRTEAARQLSFFQQGEMDLKQGKLYERGIKEYLDVLLFNADRADTQNELGMLYINLQAFEKAEKAYKEAIRIQPSFIPTYINLAHLYQIMHKENKTFQTLQNGLIVNPKSAEIFHSLGLYYIRQNNHETAIVNLEKAARLQPENVRYQYVYAVAMAKTDTSKAITILKEALRISPNSLQLQKALMYYQ